MVFFVLGFYRFIFWLTSFYWIFFLRRRIRRGKEDPKRWPERLGKTSLQPSSRPLIWLNAVSVGETLATLPLIERLPEIYPSHKQDIQVLLTTTTTSAAEIIKDRLPPHAFHQYAVLDHPLYVKRFLSHWNPRLAIWVESELWPTMITFTAKRNIPMALINARLSPSAFRNWLRAKTLARFLLSRFNVCLAQNETNANRLRQLGAQSVLVSSNLKYDSAPLSVEAQHLKQWQNLVAQRKIFLAASTHEGEEEHVIKAHLVAKTRGANLMTMIAPRHPMRGYQLAEKINAMGLSTQQLSQNALPQTLPDIYIIDRLGRLGLFYRLAHIVFMGGSLIEHGGQNPLEPARLDCALMSGGSVFNFSEVYDLLSAADAVKIVTKETLSEQLSALLLDDSTQQNMSVNAKLVAQQLKGALEQTLAQLKILMEKI